LYANVIVLLFVTIHARLCLNKVWLPAVFNSHVN